MDPNPGALSDVCFRIGTALYPSSPGIFVEAGAFDGVVQSNTLRLERESNWVGLLIEPSPVFAELTANRSSRNHFIHAGLTGSTSQKTLSGVFSGALNDTADPSLVERIRGANPPATFSETMRRNIRDLRRTLQGWQGNDAKAISEVPAMTLGEAIDASGLKRIDLLSLDVEGMELNVISGHDWPVRPRVMIIETRLRDVLDIISILTKQNFHLVASHDAQRTKSENTFVEFTNLIWVDANDASASCAVRRALQI